MGSLKNYPTKICHIHLSEFAAEKKKVNIFFFWNWPTGEATNNISTMQVATPKPVNYTGHV